jgi:hypothetical protein
MYTVTWSLNCRKKQRAEWTTHSAGPRESAWLSIGLSNGPIATRWRCLEAGF